MLAEILAQLLQQADAAHIALAPPGDAVAYPMLLGDDLAAELVLLLLFFLQHLIAPFLERRETFLDAPRDAAVEPHGRARQLFEEAPVMADQHQRRARTAEFALQPFDCRQVEMVGRLVEQQNVRLGREHARQRRAARFAAREARGVFLAGQPELFEQITRAMRVIAGCEARFHVGERCGEAGQVRLLRQVADGGARLREARAAIHAPPCRPRSSAASICPSRCARRGTRRSRSPIERSAPSSSGVPPKVRWTSWSVRRGGAMRAV